MNDDDVRIEAGKTGEQTGEGEVKSLDELLTEERSKAERYLSNWKRAEADLDNYRKRVEIERAEVSKYANVSLIMTLLPVIDDLERALASKPPEMKQSGWVEGIELIYRKLKAVLESWEMKEIVALGEDFNPAVHEAVAQVDGEEGKVVEEIQRGYKVRDRVIRPALVAVGTGRRGG